MASTARRPSASSPRVDRKIARNAGLRARQPAAHVRMESALAEAPNPAHQVDCRFEPVVAARRAVAGLTIVADLLALIRRRQQRWYTSVPRLGPKSAERITGWLSLHAASLGELSPLATTPRWQFVAGHPALARTPRLGTLIDVMPLESLQAIPLPAELDGSQGLNRAPHLDHQIALERALDASMGGLQAAARIVCKPARSGTVATVVNYRQAQAAVVAEHTGP
ncbi:hypothetical protein PCAR4_390061 [Paraburkholderia caribensis]|nr:hypothetical protein PCAR4_390061 [Paraburkholderia caribensis]